MLQGIQCDKAIDSAGRLHSGDLGVIDESGYLAITGRYKDMISRYKIPKHITFVDGYPMTASGKIQKYKLQEMSVELFPGEDRIPQLFSYGCFAK